MKRVRTDVRGAVYDLYLKGETGSEFERFTRDFEVHRDHPTVEAIVDNLRAQSDIDQLPEGAQIPKGFDPIWFRDESDGRFKSYMAIPGSRRKKDRNATLREYCLSYHGDNPSRIAHLVVVLLYGHDKTGNFGPILNNDELRSLKSRYKDADNAIREALESDYELATEPVVAFRRRGDSIISGIIDLTPYFN